MAEGVRLLQVGTVGGSPVNADVKSLGSDVVVRVIVGGTDYVATRPPGWPSRPQNTGTAFAEGSTVTFTAGSIVSLLACEANALIAGGWASAS